MPETSSTTTPSMTALRTLLSAEHGATCAELAERGGIGRSTAGKTLAGLEARGLARRVSDQRTSGVRAPDLWFAAAPDQGAEPDCAGQDPVTAERATKGTEPRTDPTPGTSPHEKDPTSSAAHCETGPAKLETAGADPQQDGEPVSESEPEPTSDTAPTGTDPVPQEAAVPSGEAPATPARAESAAPVRLAKGGLRAQVIEHLTAHPDQEFTAPKLSRILGRSSGAISNVFDTLVKTGQAEMTCEKPRTFRRLTAHAGR